MRTSSGRVAFVTDRAILIRTGEAISYLADASQAPVWDAMVPGLLDFGMVGSIAWLVATDPMRVIRLDPVHQSQQVTHIDPLPPNGMLVTSSLVPHCATWVGTETSILAAKGDRIECTSLVKADFALPALAGKSLVAVGHTLVMLRDAETLWRTDTGVAGPRVIGGATTFDGRAILLLGRLRAEGSTRLSVIGMRNGVLQTSIVTATLEMLRAEPHRGQVLVIAGGRLRLLDLRFGRELDSAPIPSTFVDVELSATAQVAAYIEDLGDGERVEVLPLREVFDRLRARAREEGDGAAEPCVDDSATVAVEAPAELEARATPLIDEPEEAIDLTSPIEALGPARSPPEPASGELAGAINDAWMKLIGAWVERAIAEAWDSGRLAIPTQSAMPFESEVRGILEHGRGRAPERLRAAELHIAQHDGVLQDLLGRAGSSHPLARFSREFELSANAQKILMVVAAPIHVGEMARLYAILTADPARSICDELLVSQILGPRVPRADVARELDPDRPLRRFGLVLQGGANVRPFAALRVDTIFARLLRGHSLEDPTDDEVRPSDRDVPLSELRLPRKVIAQALRELRGRPRGALRVAVRGRTGSGRRTLVAALARLSGRRVGTIDLGTLGATRDARLDALPTALQRAVLRGWVPCVEGFEDMGVEDPVYRERFKQIFRRHPGPVFGRLAWDAEAPFDAGFVPIDLPIESEQERIRTWKLATARHRLEVRDPAELASRFRCGPGLVLRACEAAARDRAAGHDADTDASQTIETMLQRVLESQLGSVASRITRTASWAEVVLPDDVMDSLIELVARIRHRKTVFDEWGFDVTMSTSRGVVALFQGGPGTGKTMVAGVIARELGLDLYRVDLARIVSKWVGETEKNLAQVFDAAEDGRALLLFDEADALFGRRTSVQTANDRYANLEINYLLQRLDVFEGVAVLTTNLGSAIDPAFLRRLTLRLTFPFPDDEMRERLWRTLIPARVPRTGAFDLDDLARRYRLSGGYIRNAALRAAFLAAEEGSALTQAHLERAIRLEYREFGKLAESGTLE